MGIVVDMNKIFCKLLTLQSKQKLSIVIEQLKNIPWDSEGEQVILKNEHIIHILQLFITDKFSAEDVECWANLIEGREDIDYEQFNEIIYELANPILTFKLTKARANSILKSLV